jgi:hypothetical protein
MKKALGHISLSVAGEKGLLEAAVGSGSLRRHHANQVANQVANSGDDVRREGAQDMAVAQGQQGPPSRKKIARGSGRRQLVRGWLVAPPPGPE